jgi:hypothetical protein
MRNASALFALSLFAPAFSASAADRIVSSPEELRDAFANASAGDTITVAPGTYRITDTLWTRNDGEPGRPITVKADRLGDVRLDFESREAIVINNTYWVLADLWINGACANPNNCETAVGVKPSAHGFVLHHSRVSDWYQHIKGSRTAETEVEDVTISGCELYNAVPRRAQVIDVVGGKRWRIIGNYVHDFGGGTNGEFGIFLKGATSDGIIEQNLVLCAKDRPLAGTSVGISLGQGGSDPQYCPNQDCSCEDRNGIVRNNIVAHCTDTGLHALRACGGRFYNNTVYDTLGGLQIQEDSPLAPVEIRNNMMSQRIFGGSNYVASDNLVEVPDVVFQSVYAEPDQENFGDGADLSAVLDRAAILSEVTSDYCGRTREGSFDFGAIEFPAACVTWPWSADRLPPGTGNPGTGNPPGNPGTGNPGTGNPGTSPDPGADLDGGGPPEELVGSCSCDASNRSRSPLALIALAIALGVLLRRREVVARTGWPRTLGGADVYLAVRARVRR